MIVEEDPESEGEIDFKFEDFVKRWRLMQSHFSLNNRLFQTGESESCPSLRISSEGLWNELRKYKSLYH